MKMMGQVLALAAFCSASAASATAYTDEAAWRAAISNVYGFEDFDAIAPGSDVNTLPSLGVKLLPLDDGTQPTVQPYSFTGGVVRSGPNNLLNDRDNTLPGRGPISVAPINSADYIYGLGMWNVGGDDQLKLSFYDGSGTLVESVTSAISSGFFGIVNPAGGKLATIDFVEGNGYAPTDDWQGAVRSTFIPMPGVPEPATWAMMVGGFGMVGGALRRRRVTTRVSDAA